MAASWRHGRGWQAAAWHGGQASWREEKGVKTIIIISSISPHHHLSSVSCCLYLCSLQKTTMAKNKKRRLEKGGINIGARQRHKGQLIKAAAALARRSIKRETARASHAHARARARMPKGEKGINEKEKEKRLSSSTSKKRRAWHQRGIFLRRAHRIVVSVSICIINNNQYDNQSIKRRQTAGTLRRWRNIIKIKRKRRHGINQA